MIGFDLVLCDEERSLLTDLLEHALKEMRVEEHRTRAPLYRQGVIRRKEIVVGMLKKLTADRESVAVN